MATYKVELASDGWWLRGVPEAAYKPGDFGDGSYGPPQIFEPDEMPEDHPDTWLAPRGGGNAIDQFEYVYSTLYEEYQTNDILKPGDIFETPVGQFICADTEVVPNDETSKKLLNDVNQVYGCENCGCDQGFHRKRGEEDIPYYAECTLHPECKLYKKKGIPVTFAMTPNGVEERVVVTREDR